jgi:predicted ATPase
MTARITELRIAGLRTLADVTLPLDGLTVLIGSNGSGKSSLVEAIELLRKLSEPKFYGLLHDHHGGLHGLLRRGVNELSLSVSVALDDASRCEYSVTLALHDHARITKESLVRLDTGETWLQRDGAAVTNVWTPLHAPANGELALHAFGNTVEPIRELKTALAGIGVHLPFNATARWAASEQRLPPGMRDFNVIEPATGLARFGSNLANAYHTLRNDRGRAHWEETLDYVQLGLGMDVEDVSVTAAAGGGQVAIAVESRLHGRIPAYSLSDGMLSYLAFVALHRLDEGRTLLAFDEPELHLHPALLMRVLAMFGASARKHPVVLATHSDRLLDGLSDPAAQTAICALDEHGATRIDRLDADRLGRWLEDYRGLGELRADGELGSVIRRSSPADEP